MFKHHRLRTLRAIPTLTICASLAAFSATPLMAQEPQLNAQETKTSSQQTQQYTLPAGRLASSLNAFARQAGITLSVDPVLVEGKTAAAVSGNYTAQQVLQQLLQGSDVVFNFTDAKTVALARDGVMMLGAVKVGATAESDGSAAEAYRVDNVNTGVLGNTNLQNTPYSIEVYSKSYMDNLQARSLSDLTKYDASISLSSGDLVGENNSFVIRGIRPDFDTGQKIDGMNLRSRSMDLPLEHVEHVEVLKGAGGFLYGFGVPGGIVNYVTKRPTDDLASRLNAQITDSGLLLLHGDVGGRIGEQDRFGYRVNLVNEAGDTYINDGESERKSGSVALDWNITENLTWQVDALYADRESNGGYWNVRPNSDGMAANWAVSEPLAPIDGDKRLVPDWMLYASEHKTYGTDLLWAWSDNWDMKLSHRHSSSYRYLMSPVIFADVNGNYSTQSWNYNNLFESDHTQAIVTGELATGTVNHNITAGLSHTKTVSSNSSRPGDRLGIRQIENELGNFANPVDFISTMNTLNKSDAEYWEYSNITREELFLSDTIHFGDNWDLVLGARHGTLENKNGNYKESAITPTLAAIYRPREWMSIYASYVEAFEEGATAPDTANNSGEIFDPLTSDQFEMGIKIDKNNWSSNIALFQLQQGATYTDSNNNFSQDGEVRYKGLEISGKANISENWLLGASAALLDVSYEKTTNQDLEGKNYPGVAREEIRFYSEYDMPNSDLVLTGGVQYTGKRSLDADELWSVGSITLVNLGARYQLNIKDQPVILRLNIDNVTDEAYWLTQAGGSYLNQGAPRTAKFGMQIDF